MNKTLSYFFIFALTACAGTVDPNQDEIVPYEYTEPYTLVADKTEVEASGADYVTFSLMDAYGRDILADRNVLDRVKVLSSEGHILPRLENKTRFIENGTHAFSATYTGVKSENTVEIVAKNRSLYEKYHKNVALYKVTGTWCPACPNMTTAIEAMNEEAGRHSVEMCWHGNQSSPNDDPYALPDENYIDCGNALLNYFARLESLSLGFPTVILDLETVVMQQAASVLETEIWNLRADYPATSGIKLSSEYDSAAGRLKINAELTSSAGGEYDMGFALLLNDQIYPGGTADGGRYSHIVSATNGNVAMYSNLRTLEKDVPESFEYSIFVREGFDADEFTVVAYSLVKHGERARIDNIVEAKVGESIDYVCNE